MKFSDYRSRAPNRTAAAVVIWWIIVRNLVRLVLWLVYRLRCFGREHVPNKGPVVFAANHQSHYDPPIIGVLVGPFSSLARSGLFSFKPFGWLLRQCGAIPMVRRGGASAGALRAGVAELQSRGRLLIYPEGSRTRDGTVTPFRPGVLVLLRRVPQSTVVPVAIEGAFDVWPITRRYPRLRGRIMTMAGPGIPAEELLSVTPHEALQRLHGVIDAMRLDLRRKLRERSGGRYPAPGPGDECAGLPTPASSRSPSPSAR